MQLYRSNRAEALVDALAGVVGTSGNDPFEEEWVVVQGRGIERWLSLELAERLGLFAHARFPFPRHFLDQALAAVLGDGGGKAAAWEPESLIWAIAEQLPARLIDPAFAPIRNYLAGADGDGKRLALARRIAETFDHYAVYRPEMVLAWEQGKALAPQKTSAAEWQALLWRDLVDALGGGHGAARVRDFLSAIEAGARPGAGWPGRVSLFGLSTLPPLYVSAVAGLADFMEVHVFLLSPSREYWAGLQTEREKGRLLKASPDSTDAEDLHLGSLGPPLLASLGRVGRDFQEILEERTQYSEIDHDLYVDPCGEERQENSLLRALQSDMLALRGRGDRPGQTARMSLGGEDDSLAIHACHGPMREAEVLRDQLLELFNRHADLTPRDVVVMAPDASRYAPFVEAAFMGSQGGAPGIPVSVADQGVGRTFPTVDAFLRAIGLLDGRLEAGPVLELLASDPVRARFGLTNEDEALLRAWIELSGIRWGRNAEHRAREGQPETDANTWRFGLDRLLTGLAIEDGPDRLFSGVVPQAGVEGAQAAGLGRLVELTDAVFALHARATEPRTVIDWTEFFIEVLDALIEVDADCAHERTIVVEALGQLADSARVVGSRTPIQFSSAREAIESQLARGTATGGFVTGAVTVCEMVPMRSIPFRVVALMGMNDGEFPRSRPRPSFDLIGASEELGDRSAREDDRQMFLEALLSARDHLLVTYVGQGIRDNEPRPPSVIVEELLEAVARMVIPPELEEADASRWIRERIVVRHPLQPWSPRYFSQETADTSLFSYSSVWREASAMMAGPSLPAEDFLTQALQDDLKEIEVLSIGDVCAYFANPARSLAMAELGLVLSEAEELDADREPLDVDGLEAFLIGEEMLNRALSGEPLESMRERLAGQGRLPLGQAGRVVFEELAAEVTQMTRQIAALREGPVQPDRRLELQIDPEAAPQDNTVLLFGHLTGFYPGGRVVQRFAKPERPSELTVWIEHLLLCASGPPDLPRRSHFVGRRGSKGKVASEVCFEGVEDAPRLLADLVRIYQAGRKRPLPLFPKASRKFAERVGKNPGDPTLRENAWLDAQNAFTQSSPIRAERDEVYVRQFFGRRDPLALNDRAAGLELDAEYGFSRLAERVFGPLFAHRTVTR
ncbi:MAG: exodeoxyribonuclease V subunit gamma [Myxococcota bacterium]|nr:exodeoxyribonuclease V subunit gamma [Myxococcota bacterium]